MQKKAFIFTALLSGLGTMLFGTTGAVPGIPTAAGSFGPVAMAPFVFSPTTIPDGLYGSAYVNQTLTIAGGVAPYTFSVSGGSMPSGISLSAGGVFSGTPTAAGKYSLTFTAQDNAHGRNKSSGSQGYTLVIDQAVLTITANNASMLYGGSLTKKKNNGTGLGLAIVRQFVNSHGGTITVKNVCGAVFTIQLPVV